MQENLNDSSAESVMELILSGGLASTIIMIVLFIFLLGSMYITIERYLVYRSVLSTLNRQTTENEILEQMQVVASHSFSKYNSSAKAEKAIENWASSFVFELERNTSTLATLSGAAPMLGFLGTVIGMILAFREMAVSQGQAEIASLAGGIYTAMITTVGGLIVGIISYIAYNQLATMLTQITKRLESEGNKLIDSLEN